jgi:hypothetical protein
MFVASDSYGKHVLRCMVQSLKFTKIICKSQMDQVTLCNIEITQFHK